MQLQLSICIPTYNRCSKLLLLLESIQKQITRKIQNNLEIIISDNNSTDDTEKKINEFVKKNRNIKIVYIKNDKNMGIDFNIKNAIKNSKGKYVWLMGDDELLNEYSIDRIMQRILIDSDIFILNGSEETDLNALNAENLKIYEINSVEDIKNYIETINNNLRFFFCLISSLVFKRNLFLNEEVPKEVENSIYDHLFVFLSILKKGAKVCYLKENYYIVGREENEWNTQRGKHLFLDLETLYRFFNFLFVEEEQNILRKEIGKLLKRQHKLLRTYLYLFEYSKKIKKVKKAETYLKYFGLYSIKIKILKILGSSLLFRNTIELLKKMKGVI